MTSSGIGGHQSPVNQTAIWLTPPHILAALGHFDTDPCAHDGWITADHHILPPQDGLQAVWKGRVWLNPPYGGPAIIRPWLCRMAQHNHGTALVFARTETEMFHQAIWPVATAVLFLRGRLHFCYPDGRQAANNSGAPSVLVAYGDDDAHVLAHAGLAGKYIGLSPRRDSLHSLITFPS
jgi:hypothetical protein